MISPEFFTSQAINSLEIDTAMTFAGIWCYCDDHGRGEDDVDLIKAAVWPRRRSQTLKRIERHLDELAARSLICRYTVNGFALLHCPSWSEHQKLNRPTPSKIAPCSVHEPDEYEAFACGSDTRMEKFRNVAQLAHESLRSVS